MNDGWVQKFVIQHNAMLSKHNIPAFAASITKMIPVCSDGFWKVIHVDYNEFEIELLCKYVEGDLTNGKE